MRNLKHIYYLILVTVFLFTYGQVQGQSTALDWSYATFGEKAAWGEVVDVTIDETTGDVYEYGYTSSAGKPTTDGSVMNPGDGSFFSEYDFYVSKFDSDGNLIYRKYIGGSKYELSVIGAAQNGYFYMAGQTISTDYPVTDGSTFGGGASNADIAFTVIDPSGNIFFSTYIGGTEGDFLRGLEVLNDRIVIMGSVNSTTLPTTNSTTFGGGSDIYTIVYDLSMNVLASSYIGGNSTDNNPIMLRNNGKYFFIARTNSTDFPVTDGSSINSGVGSDYVFATLDDNLNIIDARFLGTVNSEQSIHREMLEVDDDYLYFAPPVRHSGLVTTNGTDVHTTNVYDIYFAKFNHDLSLSYATYFDYEHQQNGSNIRVENGEAYISMYTNGEAGMPNTSGIPANTSTVNSSSIYHDFYVMKIDQSNTIAYATFLGGSSTEQANYIGVEKGEMFLVGNTRSNDITSTDGSVYQGSQDIILYQLDNTGAVKRAEYIGTPISDENPRLSTRECDFAITYRHNNNVSQSTTYNSGNTPTSDGITNILLRYSLDPEFPTTNDISPLTQSPCLNGIVEIIEGNAITSDNGNYTVDFQWQVADDASGPWADIPSAILNDFEPPTDTSDKYYRRLAYDNSSCTPSLLSTSNTSVVVGSINIAPTADAGGVFYVCAGDPVVLGTTEDPNLDYLWDMASLLNPGGETSAEPTATVTETTIFALQVTDGNGCINLDQAVVNVPVADAGPDRETCQNIGKQIGTSGLPVASGVTYEWSAIGGVADLTCSTCAQTLATPGTPKTYTLTVRVPLGGGGECVLTDEVVVTPVTIPTPGFAGPDRIVCFGDNADLGLPAVAGYEYTWAPGNNLYANDEAQTVFNSGGDYPSPNPFTYYLTAANGECTFSDDMTVTMINEVEAGPRGCGPRYIGVEDMTPNVNETYSWTVVFPVAGAGEFLGTTTDPIIPVGATTGDSTIYQVEVCFGGVCCTDQVVVTDCGGGGCGVDIIVDSEAGCPSLDFAPVSLTAVGSIGDGGGDFTYSWTPTNGLDAYNTQTVNLTSNDEETYMVTLTSTIDPSITCSQTVMVNGPWVQPTFSTQSHDTCPGESVDIGGGAVLGYTYAWSGPDGFSSSSSDPSVAPLVTSTYEVTVTDDGTGCYTIAEATITVVDVVADAGDDRTVCGNSLVTLGTPDPSGGVWQYSWDPSSVTWETGDATSAQPSLIVSSNLTFNVTVTDPISGCTATDEIIIIVDNTAPTLADSPDVSVCEGESVTIGPVADPNLVYLWTDPSGTLSCTDCAQPDASPSSDATYTLTVRLGEGCPEFATDDVTVTVNPLPTLNLGGDVSYCPTGAPVSIGGNAPTDMASYAWSPSSFLSPSWSIANPTSSTPSELVYTLQITDGNGCRATDEIMVTPLEGPDAGGSKTICINATTSIGNASNGGSITWTSAEADVNVDLSCTNCANPEFTPPSAGVFVFTISSNDAGCVQEDNVTITVIGVDMPTIATPAPICAGACAQIVFDENPNYSYIWTPDAGLDDPTIANPIACLVATQAYKLTIIDNSTGCYDETEVTVGVIPVDAPTIAVEDIEVCEGDPAQLNAIASPAGSYTYSWSPGAGLNNPNIPDPTVFSYGVGTKSYDLQVTDTNTGCSSLASADVIIKPCITLSGKVWIDADGNITLDGSEVQTNAGGLYVYLVDPVTGLVLDVVALGPDGEYEFDVDVNSSYDIVLSDSPANVNDPVPTPDLPGGYYNTGESRDGSTETYFLGEINAVTGLTDLENQNFGIQQVPDSDSYTYDLGTGDGLYNTTAPLLPSDGMGPISGSDPEDGAKGTGDSFEITDLSGMNGNKLFYDLDGDGVMDPGEELSEGDIITNYNPNLLSVVFCGLGSTSFIFEYISYDEAGAKDPTPATYEVTWGNDLPVEMLYFKAYADECTGILKWATASEENNSHFVIEKSIDGREFFEIGRVDGAGNSTEKIRYSFEDGNLDAKNSYYKLKQVDFDGQYDYSDIEVIRLDSKSRCVNPLGGGFLYPNPNSGQFAFSIELDDEALGTKFYVTDMLGQQVDIYDYDLTTGGNRIDFDLGGLPTGTYFLKIENKKASFSYRIVVVDED